MRQLWLDADLTSERLTPSPDQRRRLRRVLRLRDGAELRVADGRGARRVYRLQGDALEAVAALEAAPPPKAAVHVGVGVLKGERQSWLLQKLVETGATSVAPLAMRHCVVKLDPRADPKRAEKRLARWQAIAVEAFEQCGRAQLPVVHPVDRLAAWLGSLPPGCAVAWCEERGAAVQIQSWADAAVRAQRAQHVAPALAIVIGPEGGFSDEERTLLARLGATPVGLGEAILRAETAAIVATWVAASTVASIGASLPGDGGK